MEKLNYFFCWTYSCSNVWSGFQKFTSWLYSNLRPRLASIVPMTDKKSLCLDVVLEKMKNQFKNMMQKLSHKVLQKKK